MILRLIGHIVFADLLCVNLGLIDRQLRLRVCVINGEHLFKVRNCFADITITVAGSVDNRRGLVRRYYRRGLDGGLITRSVGERYLNFLLALGVPIRLGGKACLDAAYILGVFKELYRLAVIARAARTFDTVGGRRGGILNGDADCFGNPVLYESDLVCAQTVEHKRLCFHGITCVIRAELLEKACLGKHIV